MATRQIPWARTFAEGVAIVVSILLVFGIQAWWEGRQDRALEHQYLQSLATDLHEDLARIDLLEERNFNRLAGATRLLEALGEDYSLDDSTPALGSRSVQDLMEAASAVSLQQAISQAARVFTLDTSSPTFDELRSTGHLRLIQNAELKRSIAEYYRTVDGSHFSDREQEIVIWEDFHRLLAGYGIAVMDTRTLGDVSLLDRLRTIPNLAAAVRRVRSVHSVQAIYTYPLRSQAEELLEQLQQELDERW